MLLADGIASKWRHDICKQYDGLDAKVGLKGVPNFVKKHFFHQNPTEREEPLDTGCY